MRDTVNAKTYGRGRNYVMWICSAFYQDNFVRY